MEIIFEESEINTDQFCFYSEDEYLKVVINTKADISLDVLKQLYRQFKKTDKIKPVMILLQPEMNIGKEGREYIHKMNKRFPSHPIAVVAQTFNESLLANFYKNFYNPENPYKIFKMENEAFDWLKGIAKQ